MAKKVSKKIEQVVHRPPVVVVLGHVDHGKSSLLEAIRDFKITSKESLCRLNYPLPHFLKVADDNIDKTLDYLQNNDESKLAQLPENVLAYLPNDFRKEKNMSR